MFRVNRAHNKKGYSVIYIVLKNTGGRRGTVWVTGEVMHRVRSCTQSLRNMAHGMPVL